MIVLLVSLSDARAKVSLLNQEVIIEKLQSVVELKLRSSNESRIFQEQFDAILLKGPFDIVFHKREADRVNEGKVKKDDAMLGIGDGLKIREITYLEEGAVLDDDIVHVEGLQIGEAFREGDEVGGVVGAVELDELRRRCPVVIAPPTELNQPPLQLHVGFDDLVRRKKNKNPWPGARRGGRSPAGTRRRPIIPLLEGFPGRVSDQTYDPILVEDPHTRHYLSSTTYENNEKDINT
nr:MutL-like protein 1 [Ipomoea batatas]